MAKIIQVFNRYLLLGGEEKSVNQIATLLAAEHDVQICQFESRDWVGPSAPSNIEQVWRMFYNRKSRDILEKKCLEFQPDILLFHNVYPVGSPSLYHAACRLNIPIVHYVHNFRPFSVGGTLYANGQFLPKSLKGNYWNEIRTAAWQNSRLKTAIFAMVMKFLHSTGWLESVKTWVCISEFMRDKFAEGGVPKERLSVLLHSWEPMPSPPPSVDRGSYLLLSRLVEEKGIQTVIDAWKILHDRLKEKTPILHIAGDGPLKSIVEDAANLNEKIEYLGLIENETKDAELTHCRAVIVPSIWWEPLGLVSYEAYDYGKPVLAAASGGLTETVQDGKTGFLHSPGNADDLANSVIKMERLSSDQRQQMGSAGRHWLMTSANVPDWRKQFNTILRSIGISS